MNKIDIIIPIYNNRINLLKTLSSLITQNYTNFNVIIVDDCSNINYDDIITFYQQYLSIEYYKLESNQGPGVARQFGLNKSQNNIIHFIDAGDIYYNSSVLLNAVNIINNYPTFALLSFVHIEEDQNGDYLYVTEANNRIHGKFYNRQFLQKYNIHFNQDYPRKNEDISFNQIIKLLLKDLKQEQLLIESKDEGVIWTFDQNSTVRSNNFAFYYKDQNESLAKQTEFILNEAKRLNIQNQKLLLEIIYTHFIHGYFNYLSAIGDNSPYITDSLNGNKYYYDNIFKNCELDMELLLNIYNTNLLEAYQSNSGVTHKFYNITLLEYINMLNDLII